MATLTIAGNLGGLNVLGAIAARRRYLYRIAVFTDEHILTN
jgi:hypothetical protein